MLKRLPDYSFMVTHEVMAEIVQPGQRREVERAAANGTLRTVELSDPAILALFTELRQIMGAGEAASLALACHQGCAIASDEKGAFRREALTRLGPGRILTTPGIYVMAIKGGLLSIEEADCDKGKLEALRFKMDFSSFRELLSQCPEAPEQ